MPTWLPTCGLAAGLIALSCGGCSRPSGAATAESEAAAGGPAVLRVSANPPVVKTLERFTTQPGRIEAIEAAPLYSKLSGYAQEVLVDIGDRVAKDQTLIVLWVPEMDDELEQQAALVAQAEAEVRQADSVVDAAKAAVATAEARVLEAEAGIARAASECARCQSEYARLKDLAESGSVTRKLEEESLNDLHSAEAAEQESRARVELTKAGLLESQANVRKSEADRVAAEARLRVAQANLARAQSMAGYTRIRAPFDGVVTRRAVDAGHFVSPANGAGKPLLTVERADEVRVFVDVPEVEAALVDAGDPAQVRVQALETRDFDGTVTRTSWSLYESNRSLRTEIDLPNPDGLLRPGMFATVSILLDRRESVLVLPVTAIMREGRDAYCCCVVSGKIERRPVRLGLRAGDEIEIVSGLDGSEMVVRTQPASLSQGQSVQVLATPD